MSEAQTLLNLQEKIEKKDRLKTKLEGEKESRMKGLIKEFKVKSVKEAESLLKTLFKSLEKKKTVLRKQVLKLEESYDWK